MSTIQEFPLDIELLVGQKDNFLYIKAKGHMTAMVCADLRRDIVGRLQENPDLQNIVVDLSECPYMDSTFMGLLVGFNKRLLRLAHHKLTIFHPTDEAKNLLEGLGLKNYLLFDDDNDYETPEIMENLSQHAKATADFILKAHEHLMGLSRENREKFQNLRSVLKSQIKRGE